MMQLEGLPSNAPSDATASPGLRPAPSERLVRVRQKMMQQNGAF